jgi:hypothetical protein
MSRPAPPGWRPVASHGLDGLTIGGEWLRRDYAHRQAVCKRRPDRDRLAANQVLQPKFHSIE